MDNHKLKLLVVEANRIIAMDIRVTVEKNGYKVIGICSTYKEAFKLNEKFNPDIVLIDISIKEEGMDKKVICKLKESNNNVAILYLTTKEAKTTLIEECNRCLAPYLVKPFVSEQLIDKINDALFYYSESKINKIEMPLLKKLMDYSHDSILITNADKEIEYVNKAFCNISGYPINEVLGQNVSILKSGKHDTLFYDKINKQLSQGKPWIGEFCNKKRNGEFYWEKATITPLLDADSKISNYLAIKEDISDKKSIEEMLDWQNVRENISWGIAVRETDGLTLKKVYPSYAAMHGYTVSELEGESVLKLVADKTKEEILALNTALIAKGTAKWESIHIRKDGSKFPVEINGSIIKNNRGDYESIAISMFDITDRKKLEKKNKRYYHQIEELGETTKHLATATLRERDLKKNLQVALDELEESKKIIEEQSKRIVDSINYAQRIQQAIIPKLEDIRKDLPKTDWFYKPKDVVSGDFPYYFKKGDLIYYAAVDCTGHGVPGAMMSLIGYLLLNDILNHTTVYSPAEVLLKLHLGVVRTLKQDQPDNKAADGMDVGICCYNTKTKELEYSGAHRPLYLVRKNENEVIQYKGGKHPVGGCQYGNDNFFPNHEVDLAEGDTVYFFSDGYPDQFGGEKELKFGPKKIRVLLKENCEKSLSENINILSKSFLDWMGKGNQIDDVLMIGVNFY